jgi:CBS domain-containing protein
VADIMTRDVISVSPDTRVRQIAETLVRNRISAVPVVDRERRLVGIVSEGDLLRRVEIGTERDRRWWVEMFRDASAAASDYIKAHGRKAKDIMTPRPVIATEDMSLEEAAGLLEKRRVKRLPVLRDSHVVGIVSRADLVRAVAESEEARVAAEAVPDKRIERDLAARIRAMPVANRQVHASVQNGVASLLGPVFSVAERRAFHVAAENTPGVRAINDRLFRWPQSVV